MFLINRADWELLRAVKATGMTVDKLNELNDPAPMPMQEEDG